MYPGTSTKTVSSLDSKCSWVLEQMSVAWIEISPGTSTETVSSPDRIVAGYWHRNC